MTAREILRLIVVYTGAALLLVWSAGPFLWQFSTSLQLDKALTDPVPSFWPSPATLEHYANVFFVKKFQLYVLNSVIVAGLTTLLCLAIGALAAFSLSRLEIKGRFGILGVVLSVSMFPQIAIVGPLYLTASNYGFLDTYSGLVIVYLALGLPLVTWVLFGYFDTLPREIDEAARMDGVGVVGLFVRIILPMSLPGLVTTGLLAFIAAWNEFLFALTFSPDNRTVPVAIASMSGASQQELPWGNIMAGSVIVTLPLIVLVLIFQRKIVAGLTAGAVKG